MVRGHALVPTYGARVTDVLRGMLRPALLPAEGRVFIVADWSSIEARVTPWLAGVTGEAKLDVFRSGRDPYIVNAAGAFRVPYEEVTDAQRQLGKVMELSCGFAGGAGAFAAMGRAYGTVLPEAEAKRMVAAWRRVNAWAPPFWTALEHAYLRAMRNPGHEFDAGRVTYLFDGQHLWYVLPSGRVLCYPFARLEEDGVSYAKASWKPKADAVEWPRGRLWSGLAAENCTQAVAADILRAALRRLPDVVLHVHDEIVQEVPTGRADRQALVDVMTTPPKWATGLPLACSAKVMTRYGK
jgi:DNA polymerase